MATTTVTLVLGDALATVLMTAEDFDEMILQNIIQQVVWVVVYLPE